VLAAAGVPIDLDPDRAGRLLDEVGLVFLFAPAFHPAMKELGTVRRELGVRTIFNALGPLANPAGATRQMIGVGRPELVALLADALAMLGSERAVVFHSANGLDELIPGVPATGIEVHSGWTRPWKYDPADVPQRVVDPADLAGGDAASNAAMLKALLGGEEGPRREAVLLNAALGLVLADLAERLDEGYERARAALDEGRALESFERLRSGVSAA
jgi:anthranilate phosphoribosyltransferase